VGRRDVDHNARHEDHLDFYAELDFGMMPGGFERLGPPKSTMMRTKVDHVVEIFVPNSPLLRLMISLKYAGIFVFLSL
jgi:hypothetical protein